MHSKLMNAAHRAVCLGTRVWRTVTHSTKVLSDMLYGG